MNTKIENKLKKSLENYDETSNTYKNYYFSFKRIHLLLGNKSTFSQYKSIDEVVEIVNKNVDSEGSKKQIYISISVVLKNVRGYKRISKKYKDLSVKVQKSLSTELLKNEMSKKQKEKLVDYKTLKKKVKELKKDIKNNNTKYDTYMLCYMYVIPIFTPRNEYMNLNVYYDENVDDTKNYLLVKKNSIEIILNKYKTFKHFGKITYKYKKKDEKEIRKYLEHLNNPDIIFKMNRQALHNKLTRNIGLSVQFIRTIKNDWYIKQKKFREKDTELQKKELITLFQHSVSEAFTSYRKNDIN